MSFIPRKISADSAARGYNNEGRGKLIGYITDPAKHEKTCRYRISTDGNPNKTPHETCTCRIGLWQEATPSQQVVNEMRATAKRTKNTKRKGAPAKKPKKRPVFSLARRSR